MQASPQISLTLRWRLSKGTVPAARGRALMFEDSAAPLNSFGSFPNTRDVTTTEFADRRDSGFGGVVKSRDMQAIG